MGYKVEQWFWWKISEAFTCFEVLGLCNFKHAFSLSIGIDLAFIENGYIYHTEYDTSDRILTDSIQRAGWYFNNLVIYWRVVL